MNTKRQAVALDVDAEVAQGVEDGGDGALAGAIVAVETHLPGRKRGNRGHEAHHGASEPAVDLGAVQVAGGHGDCLALGVKTHAHGGERRLH